MATVFDNKVLTSIQADVKSALQEVGHKYGVIIAPAGSRYTGTNCTMKLELSVIKDDGVAVNKYAEAFKVCCFRHGMAPSDLDRSFSMGGTSYTIDGYNTRARKHKLIIRRSFDGKTFKASPDVVSDVLKRSEV